MINLNEQLEIKAMAYATQFNFKVSKHFDSNFHIIPVRLGKMYLNKYATKGFYVDKQPFKAVIY